MKNIAFRVDASNIIATGHVMRCLTLAEKLKKLNRNSVFVMREHEGNMSDLVSSYGYDVCMLPFISNDVETVNDDAKSSYSSWLGDDWMNDAHATVEEISKYDCEWLIIDHYAIDHKWEFVISDTLNIKLFVIDGLANRNHNCHILLDPNYSQNPEIKWKNKISSTCELFSGPKYALLRDEFPNTLKKIKKRNGDINTVFVSFGGVDSGNATQKILDVLNNSNTSKLKIDVVIGNCYPYKKELSQYSEHNTNITIHTNIKNVANIMANADLAIGSGGTMMLERCLLGLPSIVVSIADNQIEQSIQMASTGSVVYLGEINNLSVNDLSEQLKEFFLDKEKLVDMQSKSFEVMGVQKLQDNTFEYQSPISKDILEQFFL